MILNFQDVFGAPWKLYLMSQDYGKIGEASLVHDPFISIQLVRIFSSIAFAHADVTRQCGSPYWITVNGRYQILPCKLVKLSN